MARIDEQARAWLIRLRGDPACDPEAFEQWYIADPDHAAAYDALLATWDAAGVAARGASHRGAPVAPRRRWRATIATVAAILVAVAGVNVLTFGDVGPSAASAFALRTRIGEIRTDRLPDGTRVTLDTDSRVEAVYSASERRVRLLRGRVRVAAATDPRPLHLEAGRVMIVTSGVVDASLISDHPSIATIDGAATLQIDGASQPIVAGQMVAVADGRQVSPPTAVRADATRWPARILSFDDAPLAAVVAEANRYHHAPIVLVGADVARLRFTGTFRAGDPDALAQMLSAAFHLVETRRADHGYELSAPARQ